VLEFLESWLGTHDDKGGDWWTSLEEQMKERRAFEKRDIE